MQLEHADRARIQVGDKLAVRARVDLGAVEPGEVRVQLYYGENRDNAIRQPTIRGTDQLREARQERRLPLPGIDPQQRERCVRAERAGGADPSQSHAGARTAADFLGLSGRQEQLRQHDRDHRSRVGRLGVRKMSC